MISSVENKLEALRREVDMMKQEIEVRQIYIQRALGAIEALTQLANETTSDSGREEQGSSENNEGEGNDAAE